MASTTGYPTGTDGSHAADGAQPSVAELVRRLSEQTSRLAHQEVELAKSELVAKGRQAGFGAGLFGGAGMFAFYGLGALVTTAILALATTVVAWLAALIVAGALVMVAGILALAGKARLARATPPVPGQASESVKEDVQWVRTRAQAGRH